MRIPIALVLVMSGPVAGYAQSATPVPMVSQQEVVAVQKHVQKFWNPPAVNNGWPVTIILKLNRDGTLDGPPEVVAKDPPPEFALWRDAAVKAVLFASPYTMLKPETYEGWKEIELTLDARTQPARP
jgi:hypothetical protein